MYTSSIRSKFGWFTLTATDTHLISCNWTDTQIIHQNTSSLILKEAITQLDSYLNGRLKVFDLTILMVGTPFQKKVWEELCNIPYGETVSYKEIAIAIGQDNSYRAVGAANGKNPLHIISSMSSGYMQ